MAAFRPGEDCFHFFILKKNAAFYLPADGRPSSPAAFLQRIFSLDVFAGFQDLQFQQRRIGILEGHSRAEHHAFAAQVRDELSDFVGQHRAQERDLDRIVGREAIVLGGPTTSR